MISPALGRALYDRAQPPKRFVLVSGAVHENTDALGQRQYQEALRQLYGLGAPP
jgi:hypothetical protein